MQNSRIAELSTTVYAYKNELYYMNEGWYYIKNVGDIWVKDEVFEWRKCTCILIINEPQYFI